MGCIAGYSGPGLVIEAFLRPASPFLAMLIFFLVAAKRSCTVFLSLPSRLAISLTESAYSHLKEAHSRCFSVSLAASK